MSIKKNTSSSPTEQTQKCAWLNEFLWLCAGANRELLRKSPDDHAKYAGIGGSILSTACMAALSGGDAFYFVFHDVRTSIVFAIFWGLIIFSLDRFIVNSMPPDEETTIGQKILHSSPRIILAVILGLVISKPLEMKIFEDRINSQAVILQTKEANTARAEKKQGLKDEVARRDRLEHEQKDIESRLAKAKAELTREDRGEGLSKKSGKGLFYESRQADVDNIQKELDEWNKNNSAELNRLRQLISDNETKGNEDILNGNKENGFCMRYEALEQVKEGSKALQFVSLFIALFFIVLETVPIISKIIISSGTYSKRLAAQKKQMDDEIAMELEIGTAETEYSKKVEEELNKKLLDKVAKVQEEVLDVAIERWREDELAKVNKHPSLYANSFTKNHSSLDIDANDV